MGGMLIGENDFELSQLDDDALRVKTTRRTTRRVLSCCHNV